MDYEARAREIVMLKTERDDNGLPYIVCTPELLIEIISAALASVQKETREADAKIGDRIASLHSNPAIIEGALQVATAIRSQGTDHD